MIQNNLFVFELHSTGTESSVHISNDPTDCALINIETDENGTCTI